MAKTGTGKPAAEKSERRRLNWRDITTIVGTIVLLSGLVMAIVAWVHAESTIPKILNRTAAQIEKAIEKHSNIPHPVSVPRGEFDILRDALKSDLGKVEKAVQSLKADTNSRFDRIEQKLDRM